VDQEEFVLLVGSFELIGKRTHEPPLFQTRNPRITQ